MTAYVRRVRRPAASTDVGKLRQIPRKPRLHFDEKDASTSSATRAAGDFTCRRPPRAVPAPRNPANARARAVALTSQGGSAMKSWSLLIMLAAIPWCVAVLVKVARCWSRDDVYTFSMWDGGLTLRGRALRRPAAAAFGGFALALLGVAVYLLTTWPRVR